MPGNLVRRTTACWFTAANNELMTRLTVLPVSLDLAGESSNQAILYQVILYHVNEQSRMIATMKKCSEPGVASRCLCTWV